VVAAYSLLFALGSFLLHPGSEALWYGLSFVISGTLTFRVSTLSRMFKG
jgi:hypothetical protein